MANEFIIRKGYKSLASSEITGSLNVSTDVTSSDVSIDDWGSVSASLGSITSNVTDNKSNVDSLNAATSSYLLNTTDTLTGDLTVSNALTSSLAQIASLNYPSSDGTDGQVLTTDGLGNLTFQTVEDVYVTVKNVSGVELQKGTPVHATSSVSAGNATAVIAASASDASTMPATFVLNETLADEAEGQALLSGYIQGVNTSLFQPGEVVYVGENGGFTNVKPTGSGNLIQNLGIVTKIHASNGSGWIYGSGRSNDVPNLPVGKVWVGSSTYSVTSSLVHLDEANGRLGLGNTAPTEVLTVEGSISASGDLHINNNQGLISKNVAGADRTLIELDSSNTLRIKGNDSEGSANAITMVAGGDVNFPAANAITMVAGGDVNFPADVTVQGTLTAQEFHTEYVSASILFSSGSTKFGDTSDDNHDFTGSVNVTGSIDIHQTVDNQGLIIHSSNVQPEIIFKDDATGDTFSIGHNRAGNRMDIEINGTDAHTFTEGGLVGIGLISPTKKLHVDGHISGSDVFINDWGSISASLATITDSDLDGTGTTSYIPKWSDSDTLTDSIIYDSGTNIGIGTSSPSSLLHLYSTAPILTATSTNNSSGLRYNVNGTAQTVHRFQYGGSTLMTIRDTGYVGIGTESPAYPLDVNGSMRADSYRIGGGTVLSGLSTVYLGSGGATATIGLVTTSGQGLTLNGSNVGIGTTSPAATLHVDGSILANDYIGSTHVYLTSPDSWIFRSTGGTERMKVDSAGSLLLGNTTAYQRVIFDPTPSTVLGNGTLTVTPSTSPGSGTAQFYTRFLDRVGGGTTKHNVIIDGKLGVGTTAPGHSLDVGGSININNTSYAYKINDINVLSVSATYTQLYNPEGAVGIYVGDSADRSNYYDNNYHYYRTAGGSSVLGVWNSTGLGIGLSSPAQKLHINGNLLFENNKEIRFIDTSATQRTVTRVNSSNELEFGWSGAGPVKFMGGGSYTERMRIHTDGNVGIGTTSPRQKLDVSSTIIQDGGFLQKSGINLGTSDLSTGNEYISHHGPILTNGSGASISTYGYFKGYQAVYASGSGGYNPHAQGAYSNPIFEFYSANRGNITLPADSPLSTGYLYQFVLGNNGSGTNQAVEQTNSNSSLIWGIKSNNDAYFANNISGSDLYIDDWGSVSASLATIVGNDLDGSGTANDLAMWSDSDTLTDAPIAISGNNATFAGDVTVTGGDITLGTDSIASNINAVGDVLAFKVDSNENTGGTPNIQFKVGSATELTIDGSTATFAGDVSIGPKNNATVQVSESGGATVKMLAGSVGRVGTYSNNNFILTTNSQNALTLDTSQNATFTGNVGIGTTSSNNKLDVRRSNSGIVAEFHSTAGTSDEYVDVKLISGNTTAGTYGTILRHQRVGTSGADFAILTNPTLTGTPVERMRITKDGNVGIGTDSPIGPLDVYAASGNANAYIRSNTGNAYLQIDSNLDGVGREESGIIFSDNGSAHWAIYKDSGDDFSIYDYTGGYKAFEIFDDGRMDLMPGAAKDVTLVTGGGNVGIGTTSPTGKFNSYISATRQLTHNGNGGDLSIISDNNSTPVMYIKGTGTADLLNVFDNTTEVFTILDGGAVGIDQTSPQGDIHIGNNDGNRKIILHGANSQTNSSEIIFGDASAGGNISAPTYAGMGIRFDSANNNLSIRSFWDNSSTIDTGIVTFDRATFKATFAAEVEAVTITETSAKRFKENIQPLDSQVDNINKLNPVTFDWKRDSKADIGFIAEEVQEIYPDLVSVEDGEVKGIQYSKLTAVLVKALQDQQKQIDELKQEIFILKQK